MHLGTGCKITGYSKRKQTKCRERSVLAINNNVKYVVHKSINIFDMTHITALGIFLLTVGITTKTHQGTAGTAEPGC